MANRFSAEEAVELLVNAEFDIGEMDSATHLMKTGVQVKSPLLDLKMKVMTIVPLKVVVKCQFIAKGVQILEIEVPKHLMV